MPETHTTHLFSPDRGIDALSPEYPDTVTAVLIALGAGTDPASQPDEHLHLAARSVDALNEVAEWANEGQSADPTACAWLSYLRWAGAAGARPPASSPAPPARDFDRDFPLLGAGSIPEGDSYAALATGEFGTVSHPVAPEAQSSEVLARSVAYGLVPRLGWKTLIPLVVDAAAITHGHAEAQTAAAATALAVHAATLARESDSGLQDVLTHVRDVCAGMTRPAPRTHALLTLAADPAQRSQLDSPDSALTRGVGSGTEATSALVLGLSAAALADDAGGKGVPSHIFARAQEIVTAHPVGSRAAGIVAASVVAARRGTSAVPRGDGALTAELEGLATAWCGRWCG